MRRTKAEAEETRARLLDAAEHLFFEHGVSSVTLEKIASTAGLTRGAIYWHFANKAEILRALDQVASLDIEALFDAALETEPEDPLATACTLALDAMRLIATDERRQRIYSVLIRSDYRGELAELLKWKREVNERYHSHTIRLFEAAHRKGHLSAVWQPGTAAHLYDWFFMGLLFDWLDDPRAYDLVAKGDEALRALLIGWSSPARLAVRADGTPA
ncbi:TetR family transcriptional regulator [Azorhizobium oxalatiphilum]|uniref:TetR family transcriptional regulator n=1 Tax=Azorhizobium oxalatiphilum TaxID=980631 RepID=A0A917CFF3_9HYPH|nr:TetR family transcriptional regulator [Azorhizobium oxalatiphilum]GGF84889.1 TetR family transcriptional regulator [Azorhizobium oxalatiphilum]